MLIDNASSSWLQHAGMRLEILLDAAATQGRAALCELIVPRGGGMPRHLHADEDETLIVVDGTVDVWRDADRRRLTAPGAWALPRRVPHRFEAVSEDARVLLLLSPAGLEATLAAASVGAGEPPLDPDDVAALLTNAGVTLLGGP